MPVIGVSSINGQARCIAFGGRSIDKAIVHEVLRVVQPAAVEAAILASEQEACKQDDVLQALRRDLEAARYSAERAQKQYDAADPENRHSARQRQAGCLSARLRRWQIAFVECTHR